MDPDYVIFARIVETGSLSAAGRLMAISPAMISKRLKRLEARLGIALLHRTTRKLGLTDAGRQFYADVHGILQAIDTAEQRIVGVRGEPSGALRISAPTSFGRLHIAPILGDFLDRFPRVRLELDLSDGYVDLFDGRFDLAVRITATRPPGLQYHRLCDSRRILCASPSYLQRHDGPSSVAALHHHRLLAATGQMPWRLVNGGRSIQISAESHVKTNSSEVVRELAIAGAGIALRSLWDIETMLATRTLVPVLPGWGGSSELAVYAVHPRAQTMPAAVTAVISQLKASLNGGIE